MCDQLEHLALRAGDLPRQSELRSSGQYGSLAHEFRDSSQAMLERRVGKAQRYLRGAQSEARGRELSAFSIEHIGQDVDFAPRQTMTQAFWNPSCCHSR